MKRTLALGIVGGLAAAIWGVAILLLASPVAAITNATPFAVTVSLATDVGESYSIGLLQPGESRRISISGRDKLLWAEAQYSNGTSKQSEKLYTTTQGTVTVLVKPEAVGISYEL